MSNRPHIDDLFRKELDGMEHEYSDALWQKLDTQLQPERDAFNKKDKKRRAAWLILPLALLLGGATWYFAGRPSSAPDKPEAIAAYTEQHTGAPVSKDNTAPQNETQPAAQLGMPGNTEQTDHGKTPPATQPGHTGGNRQENKPQINTAGHNNITARPTTPQVQQPGSLVAAGAQKIKPAGNDNKTTVTRRKNSQPVAGIDQNNAATSKKKDKKEIALPGKEDESGPAPVEDIKEASVAENNPGNKPETAPVASVAEPAVANKTATAPESGKTAKAKTATKKTVAQTTPGISAMAGTNLSSPFRKPGAFGGVLFTKTIDGKHIFAGLKISANQLDHQLVLSSKQNQPVVQTDAVIEKLTILQMPFGYEFKLNGKGKPATTFLQVGFEPAYIVGLRTIYYDDNGIPGGPVTPVANSPLMSKAINKFNLSFVAGVRKQITPRIGIMLNGGYSLIDITDKQYYNRTSTNNNLKYIQAGMLFRLNK